MATASLATAGSTRKKQTRFSPTDDVCLLKEVLLQNPFGNRSKWSSIAQTVTYYIDRPAFDVDARRVRERTTLLMEQFRKKNAEAIGTGELEYGDKQQLLQDIAVLAAMESTNTTNKRDNVGALSKEMRKRSMETISPTTSSDEPGPSSAKKPNLIAYLSEKAQHELSLKREELLLEKEKLKLEKERFEFEKEERRQRLEVEGKEKTMMFKMMQALIDKVNKE